MRDDDSNGPVPDSREERPVRRLRELEEEPDAQFLNGIRARINRRLFAAQTLDFSVRMLFRTLFDYLTLALSNLRRKPSPEEENP